MRCSLQQGGWEGQWHIISCYGPTFYATEETKEAFSEALQEAYNALPLREVVCIVGDFNCRVGSRLRSEDALREILGAHGLVRRYSSGEKLIECCQQNALAILNTFFAHNEAHTASWINPRFKTGALLDFALMRTQDRRFAGDVMALPGADIDSDHRLVRLKLMHRPQPYQSVENAAALPCRPARLAVQQLKDPEVRQRFKEAVERQMDQITSATGSSHSPTAAEMIMQLETVAREVA